VAVRSAGATLRLVSVPQRLVRAPQCPVALPDGAYLDLVSRETVPRGSALFP